MTGPAQNQSNSEYGFLAGLGAGTNSVPSRSLCFLTTRTRVLEQLRQPWTSLEQNVHPEPADPESQFRPTLYAPPATGNGKFPAEVAPKAYLHAIKRNRRAEKKRAERTRIVRRQRSVLPPDLIGLANGLNYSAAMPCGRARCKDNLVSGQRLICREAGHVPIQPSWRNSTLWRLQAKRRNRKGSRPPRSKKAR